jgi:hypothetical protein
LDLTPDPSPKRRAALYTFVAQVHPFSSQEKGLVYDSTSVVDSLRG